MSSLANLVQQREQQNAKKLELLAQQNAELSGVIQRMEEERIAFETRLSMLENACTEASIRDADRYRVMEAKVAEQEARLVVRDTDVMRSMEGQANMEGRHADMLHNVEGRITAQESRMAYLEQGAEERFVLVEEAQGALEDQLRGLEEDKLEDLREDIGRDREATRAVSELAESLRREVLQIGEFLTGKTEDWTTELAHRKRRHDTYPVVDTLTRLTESISQIRDTVSTQQEGMAEEKERLAGLARGQQEHAGTLRELAGKWTEQSTKLDSTDSKVDGCTEQLWNVKASVSQNEEEWRGAIATANGKIRATEVVATQLTEKVSELTQTVASTQGGVDAMGTRVEGVGARVAEVECSVQSEGTRLVHAEERLDKVCGDMLRQQEDLRQAVLEVQQVSDSFSGLDERGRRAEEMQSKELQTIAAEQAALKEDLSRRVDEQGRAVREEIAQLAQGVREGHEECTRAVQEARESCRAEDEDLRSAVGVVSSRLDQKWLELEEDIRGEREELVNLRAAVANMGAEVNELKVDVRDRLPIAEEGRVAALCEELERGRDVLDSIAAAYDSRMREKADEFEHRLTVLERAGRGGRGQPTVSPSPAPDYGSGVSFRPPETRRTASSPPRRALTPTPVVAPLSRPTPGSRGQSPRRASHSASALPAPPGYPGVAPGSRPPVGVWDRSGSACSLGSIALTAFPAPPPPPPPLAGPAGFRPTAAPPAPPP
eukprot:Hpha_TRINITY_DN6144_c0_g2::TRINITY_DN6144_c0_g2_i1::g.164991::m.164991